MADDSTCEKVCEHARIRYDLADLGVITVSLVSFVQIERSDMKKAIKDSLDLIGYQMRKDIQNVVIKPNMCYYWDHSTGQTTDPNFVAALVDLIRDKVSPNVNISIIESDASAMKCSYAFKILGYEKMARHHNVILVNLSEDKTEKVKVEAGGQHFHFRVPLTIKSADLRINVPKVKYLAQTKLSCALKNIFGCNPYPNKFKYHHKLEEAIVGLNKAMRFDICIVDGIVASGIQPRKLGLVMASRDSVALDSAAAKILGINPKSVRHIMLASKEGIGNTSFIPKGTNLYFRRRYPRKTPLYRIMYSAYKFATWAGLLDAEMI